MATPSTPPVSDVIETYISVLERKGRSPETIRVDKAILGRFAKHVKDIQISSVKPDHLEDWFYGPRGLMTKHKVHSHGKTHNEAISPATHNAYRARLKVFFDYCMKRNYVKCDLLEHVEPMKIPPRRRQRPEPVTLLELLDQAQNPRDRAYIAVALNTALRSNEIKRIQIRHVDLNREEIDVWISKTKERDFQPISSDLDVELRRWLTQYSLDLGRPLEPDDYLFPGRTGGLIKGYVTDEHGKRVCVRHPLNWLPKQEMGRAERIVKHAMEALGLDTRYEGTHTIRRAVARAYFDAAAAENGDVAALRDTAALLHHKSLQTTERYLGMDVEKNRRDRRIKGKPFLTAMVPSTDNVVPIRKSDSA